MRTILITMIFCYIFIFIIGAFLEDILFPWGGVRESHLKPIYLGIIFLSGLIVGCTLYIAELIKGQNGEAKVTKKKNDEEKN
ncbi:hypothetical protein ACFSKI_16165 [Pseudogracilibacillus auburnensis]|uniref:Uncharacterized protein n=1 Tax=Pseudogracilibacillus auburnensis TaxID=1494959 RepID=A0A2V3W5B6_9BACI|nr:hypothetical protein [Pseudogracilibacillus auburnensis]MBO1001581.1 hypothetical protein [Pseudogracilibacillus auburnensis]PXW89497.1 hypothetical protein DFR56_102274 [Pseudogracilibacillus auburnensis]